jgi:hypothetical protein
MRPVLSKGSTEKRGAVTKQAIALLLGKKRLSPAKKKTS